MILALPNIKILAAHTCVYFETFSKDVGPVAVGLSSVHHPSSFPSSAQWTGRNTAAYLCDMNEDMNGIIMLKTIEGTDQDYAGHHEAEQANRDDDAGDETVHSIEVLHVRVPPPIMLPPQLIVASVYRI